MCSKFRLIAPAILTLVSAIAHVDRYFLSGTVKEASGVCIADA
ncbi:MAG: hypothetical protein NTW74_10400 [Acidobacteria bacterium]|nr:hypothetical protein [Acidobacteriota bacterium]